MEFFELELTYKFSQIILEVGNFMIFFGLRIKIWFWKKKNLIKLWKMFVSLISPHKLSQFGYTSDLKGQIIWTITFVCKTKRDHAAGADWNLYIYIYHLRMLKCHKCSVGIHFTWLPVASAIPTLQIVLKTAVCTEA